MGSVIFTDEEARYIKAMLGWQDPILLDNERRSKLNGEADARTKQPVGEFRILVAGAKGVGKTSILTRFAEGTFRGEDEPPDPFYERGCRHRTEVDGQLFVIDALEMPSKHLSSNPMLEQALNITEGAVLVYDVADAGSLTLAKGLAEFVRDTVGSREYVLMLVGNKSDVDDEDRAVSWSQASKTAAALKLTGSTCSFMEVSAKTGENVANVFPVLGKEVLRLKWLGQQRVEQDRAEKMLKQGRLEKKSRQNGPVPLKRKMGLWKSLTTPFFRRQDKAAA